MKLKEYLELYKITQVEFANKLKVPRQIVNDILHNRRTVGKKMALKIQEATNGEVTVLEVLFPDAK